MQLDIPLFSTVAEVAQLARVNPVTVRREIARGNLRACRAGWRLVIPRDEVIRWLGLRPVDGARDA